MFKFLPETSMERPNSAQNGSRRSLTSNCGLLVFKKLIPDEPYDEA